MINLLYIHAFLYALMHFSILPSLFEFADVLGYSPTFAGLLIAMTPIATTISALMQNWSIKQDFVRPVLFGILAIILSQVLYIYAY